jgi:hypothetical protein
MKKFEDYILDIKYPNQNEKLEELWDIQGIIKNKSNQFFKFDLRPLKKQLNGSLIKEGSLKTKADKMVFETSTKWVLVDVLELHDYINNHSLKVVQFEDLLKKLEWNIILSKK